MIVHFRLLRSGATTSDFTRISPAVVKAIDTNNPNLGSTLAFVMADLA